MKKNYFYSLLIIVFLSIIIACNDKAEPSSPDNLTNVAYAPVPYELNTPKNWGPPVIPADNPLTVEGVALGRRLFYDPILSRDSSISCGFCHHQSSAFTDSKAVSTGIEGRKGTRSSMALVNLAFTNKGVFWDGRSRTLESQALLPVEDHLEMDENWVNAIKKIQRHQDYPTRFRKAFGIAATSEITKELAVKAIAQFERSIISKDSKFDKHDRGEYEYTDDEQLGSDMYFNDDVKLPDAQCGHCHAGKQLTIRDSSNNGLQYALSLDDFKDLGYGKISGKKTDNGKMRITTLRNIDISAPYMHDGSLQNLDEVMNHYMSGGKYSPNLDPLIQQVKLNPVQKKQVITFLKTLTDSTFLKNPAYKNPF